MFADSSNSACSRRSVNSAMPVTEVTAMTSARNSSRSSPPCQSRHSMMSDNRSNESRLRPWATDPSGMGSFPD
ncbi:MAG: hypothetical protein ACO3O6_02480 [Gemmobacter sp.]